MYWKEIVIEVKVLMQDDEDSDLKRLENAKAVASEFSDYAESFGDATISISTVTKSIKDTDDPYK